MSGGGAVRHSAESDGTASPSPAPRREDCEPGAAGASAETEASRSLGLMVQSLTQRMLVLEGQHQERILGLERGVAELSAGLAAESIKSTQLAQQVAVSEWHLSQAMKRVDELERGLGERMGAAEVLLEQVAARARAAVTGATQALKATRTMDSWPGAPGA